jgi:two-component system chemotaxis sensor kinase CheA
VNELQSRLIAAFRDEQRDYLEGIRAVLLKLGRAPENVAMADLDEAFRLAHSLKAAARVCDFHTVETIGQRVEALFTRARSGNAPAPGLLTVFEQALGAIECWAAALAEDDAAPEPVESLRALDRELTHAAPTTAAMDELAPKILAAFQVEHAEHLEEIRKILAGVAVGSMWSVDQIDEVFRRAHSLKGAARVAGLRAVESLAHELENLFASARDGKTPLDERGTKAIAAMLDAIEDAAAAFMVGRAPRENATAKVATNGVLAELAPVVPETVRGDTLAPVPLPAVETVRVSADNLDRLLRSVGQLLTEGQRQNLLSRELAGLGRQIDELAQSWQIVRGGQTSALRRIAEEPEFAPLARHLHLADLHVQAMAKKARALRRLQQRSAWDLQQQVGRLHQDAWRVRMVSADSVLQGFRKLVRDLAKEEGKHIDFHVAGFDIQADRLVLQALKDPLMHALVNAVTHGIELPEERARAGKNEVGQITLRLEVAGNRLRVEIDDDGRGIDGRRVADVAVRRGLLSEDEASALSPSEQVRLIFRPGLSTRLEVTDVSGRGMGLSVVHEAAARLQGEVLIVPRQEPGTRLALWVPLSISTQRMLLVVCREQTFGVPVYAIERLLRVAPAEIDCVEGRPMVLLAGQPVPVRTLADLLGLDGGEAGAGKNLLLMVLRTATGRLAVVVDAFLAERDGLLKNLDAPAARLRKLAGGILQEDGTVILVLNPAECCGRPSRAARLHPW